MDGRRYGGGRKIGLGLQAGPSSRAGRPVRRKHTPTSNAVVFPEPPKQPHLHSSTNFPLFSNNLSPPKPPLPQTAKLNQVSSRTKQAINHASNIGRQTLRPRQNRSPTPVEDVNSGSDSLASGSFSLSSARSSARGNSLKTDVLSVTSWPHEGSESEIPFPHQDCTVLNDHFEEKDIFPIQYLPDDCKLKIFSFLSSHDKGRAAQVCVSWWNLMRTPFLWAHVSFSDFPFWCITSEEHNCIGNCFIRYRVRVKQFMSFLKDIRPCLRSLEFKFDIGEQSDGFLQPIEGLIDKGNTRELRYACMNWKETPVRPFWTDMTKYVRCDEVMQKHRMRQRLFVNFFDLFSRQCPKVETLVLPFDWSDKSVECLLRLKNITSLVLEKYFVFQKLCQDLVDRLFYGLPNLKRLMLEVWTPSGHGLVFFALESPSIEYLDISQSRGFYLNSVRLPQLKVFRVARHPWNGPLVLADRINVPCLYDVMSEGAENLQKINEHDLEENWRVGIYPKLQEVLKSVCSCRRHKSGWAM